MAKRRALDETRSLLLDAGTALLAEDGVSVTLDRVTLIDVCRRAGLSTAGSAYKIWPNQQAFRAELLQHLVVRSSATFATTDQVTDLLSADGPPLCLDELIRVAAADNAEMNQRTYPTYLVVWLARRTDAELAATFEASEGDWLDAIVSLFTQIVEAYDLEFVPPFDAAVLGVTLSALVEGLTIRRRATPELVPDSLLLPTGENGSEQTWTPFAIGVRAIFDAYTRPRS
ncbi:MAG TPA: hypothetical protein VFN21_12835 [Acidimicrobiales bacterium]|nr:hypothetical protein [Acidimicrobiales bacterium]